MILFEYQYMRGYMQCEQRCFQILFLEQPVKLDL